MDTIATSLPSSSPDTSPTQPGAEIGSAHKEFKPLFDQFGIPDSMKDAEGALGEIWEWAKGEAKDQDRDSILWEVIRLKNRLGTTGENKPYLKVLNYVRTARQVKKYQERLQELEGGHAEI